MYVGWCRKNDCVTRSLACTTMWRPIKQKQWPWHPTHAQTHTSLAYQPTNSPTLTPTMLWPDGRHCTKNNPTSIENACAHGSHPSILSVSVSCCSTTCSTAAQSCPSASTGTSEDEATKMRRMGRSLLEVVFSCTIVANLIW